MNIKHLQASLAALILGLGAGTHAAPSIEDKFRQLDELLPTPNEYRNAAGAPGHAYWQQRADYRIKVTLDEARRAVSGSGPPHGSSTTTSPSPTRTATSTTKRWRTWKTGKRNCSSRAST